MTDATASAGLVGGLLSFAVANGAPRNELLRRAGLSAAELDDADSRTPLGRYRELIRAARESCDDPALALKWAETVDMADVSIVGLIMNASRTMGDAFLQLQRYTRLALEFDNASTQPRFTLQRTGGELWMVDTRRNPNDFPEISEISFARLVCGPRRFLKQPHVLEVHFTHSDPGYARDHERVFRCPVRFASRWNAMKLHPQIASWPVQLEPKYVFGILTKHADQLLDDIERAKTVRAKVENALLPVLHEGNFSAETIAAGMGLSRQTLYRKLREERTSFGDVVDGLRQRLATEYLQGRKASVNETAYLLGYSDPASFSRAFKRWTGENPRDAATRA